MIKRELKKVLTPIVEEILEEKKDKRTREKIREQMPQDFLRGFNMALGARPKQPKNTLKHKDMDNNIREIDKKNLAQEYRDIKRGELELVQRGFGNVATLVRVPNREGRQFQNQDKENRHEEQKPL
jgi:aminopeptidase C